ncbi:hypothetical protein [Desulfurobacterium sp.]
MKRIEEIQKETLVVMKNFQKYEGSFEKLQPGLEGLGLKIKKASPSACLNFLLRRLGQRTVKGLGKIRIVKESSDWTVFAGEIPILKVLFINDLLIDETAAAKVLSQKKQKLVASLKREIVSEFERLSSGIVYVQKISQLCEHFFKKLGCIQLRNDTYFLKDSKNLREFMKVVNEADLSGRENFILLKIDETTVKLLRKLYADSVRRLHRRVLDSKLTINALKIHKYDFSVCKKAFVELSDYLYDDREKEEIEAKLKEIEEQIKELEVTVKELRGGRR